MAPVQAFAKPQVPRDVAVQIRSYQRMQWPHLDELTARALWDISSDSTARTFVVLDGEKLVSHAEANFRQVDHAGQTFTVGGLSAVFTYPAYRGKGYARQVVAAATEFLDGTDADLAMLFCGDPVRGFYTSLGWEASDSARIYRGPQANPVLHEGNVVMMRFISPRGCAARDAFEHQPVYVGERTW